MKKTIVLLLATIFFALSITLPKAYAWDDCPKGEVDDPYPGDCSRYIDTDGDGICDHSQPAPEDRVSTEDSTTTEVTASATTSTTEAKTATISTTSNAKATSLGVNQTNKDTSSKYHFWIIFLTLLVLYIISFILYRTKTISIAAHRKFWNIVLLITFLVSGIMGLLLTIRIDNPGLFTLPSSFLFLHVEFGIAMALISIFHIIWHWPYFKCMLRTKKSEETNCD